MSFVLFLALSLLHTSIVLANTEKVIFLGPEAVELSISRPHLQDLRLQTLAPSSSSWAPGISSSLRLYQPVAFPTEASARGVDSWYLLEDLIPGHRYEVRVCWAAIQPTQFWLDTYTLSEVFDDPVLITSLSTFSESRLQDQEAQRGEVEGDLTPAGSKSTALFLKVSAAADFFSSNKTLMSEPPPVLVDLILDPYLFDLLPQSLVPTVWYIVGIAVVSWFLSSHIFKWLTEISRHDKTHAE